MHFFTEIAVLFVSFFLYWLNTNRRRYLKRRIGSKTSRNIYQTCRNFSFMLNRKDLKIKGDTHLLQKGGILYSLHFGVWELMPVTLRKLGYKLGVLVNRYHDDNKNFLASCADRFLYRFRTRNGVKVFYKNDILKIVNFIKDGGLFGMLIDGSDFFAKYDKVQRMARICDVPAVPFVAYRENSSGTLEINCNLMKMVDQRPFDYLWVYQSRSKRQTQEQ